MTDWQERMRASERRLAPGGKIVLGSGTEIPLDGDSVVKLTVNEGADGALLPGAVLSASCVLDLRNDDGQGRAGAGALIGATLLPELIAGTGDDADSAALGAFQIVSAAAIEQGAILRIQASDSVSFELSADFEDQLVYPATLQQIWNHAVLQTRYVWSGTLPNGSAIVDVKPDWKRITLRRALSLIAAAAGCFVRVTRGGALEVRRVWTPNAQAMEIGPDDYLKLEADGKAYGPVDSLKLTPVGRDTNGNPAPERTYYADALQTQLFALEMSDNPIYAYGSTHLNALAEGTLQQSAGLCGAEMRFTWRGDPTLTIGATVNVTDRRGNEAQGILSRQTLTLDCGGFRAMCACAIPDTKDSGVMRAFTPEGGLNAAALTGVIDGGLLSARSVTAEKIAARSVTAEKLAVGALDAGAIEAIAAKLQTITAADIQTDRLASTLAAFCVLAAGTATFSEAAVRHLVSEAMQITDAGVVGQMFIENLAVKSAQIVSATIGNLCVRASNGSYYRIDVSDDGAVTAAQVQPTQAEIAAGETQSGRVIVETEIAAGDLSTANLAATYALINQIDAARIDVDQLFARDAMVSKLATSLIVGGKSLTMLAGEIGDARTRAEDVDSRFHRVVNLDAAGLHVGDTQMGSEVLIDSESVNVVLNRQRYSRFAANYVQFGNYQLRRSADGGLVFRLKEN